MIDAKQIQNHYLELIGAGSRTLTTTPTLAPLTTAVNTTGTLFTHAGGVITYGGETGRDIEIGQTTCFNAGSNTRSIGGAAIFINGAILQRSEDYAYVRNLADSDGTCSWTGTLSVSNGDTIELRNHEMTAGDDVTQTLSQTNLYVKLL